MKWAEKLKFEDKMYAKYLCDHQNGFWDNLFFGSAEKLRK
jgi:hypothetical protein